MYRKSYPKDSKYYINANNLVVGKMKDKTCGVPLKVFLGWKSKLYTLITEDNHEPEIAKNINKNVVDDEVKYVVYKTVLFNHIWDMKLTKFKAKMNR